LDLDEVRFHDLAFRARGLVGSSAGESAADARQAFGECLIARCEGDPEAASIAEGRARHHCHSMDIEQPVAKLIHSPIGCPPSRAGSSAETSGKA
jgi:hypothetical protein